MVLPYPRRARGTRRGVRHEATPRLSRSPARPRRRRTRAGRPAGRPVAHAPPKRTLYFTMTWPACRVSVSSPCMIVTVWASTLIDGPRSHPRRCSNDVALFLVGVRLAVDLEVATATPFWLVTLSTVMLWRRALRHCRRRCWSADGDHRDVVGDAGVECHPDRFAQVDRERLVSVLELTVDDLERDVAGRDAGDGERGRRSAGHLVTLHHVIGSPVHLDLRGEGRWRRRARRVRAGGRGRSRPRRGERDERVLARELVEQRLLLGRVRGGEPPPRCRSRGWSRWHRRRRRRGGT